MKFVFRLEALYRLRKEEEKQAQIELGRHQKEKVLMEQALAAIEGEEKHWADVYNRDGSQPDTDRHIVLVEQYLVVLEERRRFQIKVIAQQEEIIRKAQVVVSVAYKARKQIELLRDKHREVFEQEEREKEKRLNMEMAQLRFVHDKLENTEAFL